MTHSHTPKSEISKIEQAFEILKITDIIGDSTKETIISELLNENLVFAIKQGKVIGVSGICNCYPNDPRNIKWLTYTAVLPEFQRQGIGTELLARVGKKLKRKKTKLLCVETASKRAMKFYQKNGFKKCGEIPNYYHNGEPKIFLFRVVKG